MIKIFSVSFICFVCVFSSAIKGYSQSNKKEQSVGIIMRMIGHQILLKSGDSLSIVLPVVKESDRYKIQFESEFSFNPETLFETTNQVIRDAGIQSEYIVEVEDCMSKSIVHSFRAANASDSSLIPCKTRNQSVGCYIIYITFLESGRNESLPVFEKDIANASINGKSIPYSYIIWSIISISILFTVFVYFRKRNQLPEVNSDIITLGRYEFDKKNMTLALEQDQITLTSKEADLLLLFHASANATLKREDILKNVWGDEGDYVGRTLDVFISKLRKKLAEDQNLKIINIRGIGYKFVINAAS